MLGVDAASIEIRELHSLQLCILCFGFYQDRDFRIGILPQRKEILVRLSVAGKIAAELRGARQMQVSERERGRERIQSSIVDDLFKLR